MKEFLHYFFGQGDTAEFQNFSIAHFAPILLAVAVILLIYRFRNTLRDFKHEKSIRFAESDSRNRSAQQNQ